jgi:DNA-binding LacI/PurR family transcriptional regulator
MAALTEMKIKIPDEISVVGNDDIPVSKRLPVPLTTICAPMLELGRKAAEVLIRNIESPERLSIENVVLQAEFVVRKSTRALQPCLNGQYTEHHEAVS